LDKFVARAHVPAAAKSERDRRERACGQRRDQSQTDSRVCSAVATVWRLVAVDDSPSSPRTVCLASTTTAGRPVPQFRLAPSPHTGAPFIHHNAIKVGLTNTFAARGGDCLIVSMG